MEDSSSNGLPSVDGDDLLNFSLDVDEQKQNDKNCMSLCSLSSSSASGGSSSLPEDEEEELEWISNKDSFPVVEFDVLDDKLDVGLLRQHSPVSVLESSPSGGYGNGKSVTNNWSSRGTLLLQGGFPNFAQKKRIGGRKPRTGFGQHKLLFLVGHRIHVANGENSPIPPVKVVKDESFAVGRRCLYCGTDQTPLWRAGPMGQKTLCNACGMRYKTGRLCPENQIKNVGNVQKSPITPVKIVRSKAFTVGRRCSHCGTDQTPQWRAGPMGLKTLCNACGVRYKSGRLVPEYRPASSPTFSPAVHSNSHRKIMEMRKLKQLGLGQQ